MENPLRIFFKEVTMQKRMRELVPLGRGRVLRWLRRESQCEIGSDTRSDDDYQISAIDRIVIVADTATGRDW